MNTGDKIEYTYTHHINRKLSVQRTKTGVFIRLVKGKLKGNTFTSKAVVKLDGNKNNSIVPIGSINPTQTQTE